MTEEDMSDPGRTDTPRPGVGSLGRRVWLVLGGGGLKGLAHVGAWRALTEAGVEVQGIVGTSIGALVGACVAGGMGWDELVQPALELRREEIARIDRRVAWINGIRSESVFHGEVLRDYIEGILPVSGWDDLRIPLQVNAVDLETGETVWFGTDARTDVSLVDAIYASAALPVYYPPARIGDSYFVDGGVGDALPLHRGAELGASSLFAVDVGAGPEDDAEEAVGQGLVGIQQRVYAIMSGLRRRETVASWDRTPMVLVRPRLDGYSTFDFDSVKYFLEEGYRAAREALAGR